MDALDREIYFAAKRHASYYLDTLKLGPMSEYDDVVQEVAIALWQGRKPYYAVVDYLRSATFVKRHAFWSGVRLYFDENEPWNDIAKEENYDDYVFLMRYDDNFLKLAAHKEISSYKEQSAARNNISESRSQR